MRLAAGTMIGLGKELLRAGSLENQLGGINTLEATCRRIGLVSVEEQFMGFVEHGTWIRGGAETYISTGTLYYQSPFNEFGFRKIIAKAYVGMGFGLTPDMQVRRWAERADRLAAAGASVSKVYGTYDGVLYSDYVPFPLVQYLRDSLEKPTIIWAAKMLLGLAQALDELGVSALCLLSDLRTDGAIIYLVDFGEDIGSVPGIRKYSSHCRNQLRKELIDHGFVAIAKQMGD